MGMSCPKLNLVKPFMDLPKVEKLRKKITYDRFPKLEKIVYLKDYLLPLCQNTSCTNMVNVRVQDT